ncbi:putative cytochrome P450 [Rosa chinensis]|uniref:Putative cytochrome P450 n=1 Tax=Rosa chinensis TaxID=74649 RepID=A0A2P6P6X3_ROSCH|nr:putative cytochrome P450 [Rosa chinensis]
MINKIEQSAGSLVNLSKMILKLTTDTICIIALRRKYNSESPDGKMIEELLKEFNWLMGCPNIGDVIPWLAWLSHFNGFNAKLDKVLNSWMTFWMHGVVQEHVNHRSNSSARIDHDHVDHIGPIGEDQTTEEDQKNFVDVLLEIQDMFSGGTDTTYTVLEWAMI